MVKLKLSGSIWTNHWNLSFCFQYPFLKEAVCGNVVIAPWNVFCIYTKMEIEISKAINDISNDFVFEIYFI